MTGLFAFRAGIFMRPKRPEPRRVDRLADRVPGSQSVSRQIHQPERVQVTRNARRNGSRRMKRALKLMHPQKFKAKYQKAKSRGAPASEVPAKRPFFLPFLFQAVRIWSSFSHSHLLQVTPRRPQESGGVTSLA